MDHFLFKDMFPIVNNQHIFPGIMSPAGLITRIVRLRVHAPNGSLYDWYNFDTIRLQRFTELRNKADEIKEFFPQDGLRLRKIFAARERINR